MIELTNSGITALCVFAGIGGAFILCAIGWAIAWRLTYGRKEK